MHEEGYCACGCGKRTTVYQDRARRFVTGHNRRSSPVSYVEEDHGFRTPCWIWQLYKNPKGYGMAGVSGTTWLAHRKAWEVAHGRPIPAGKQIDHLCRQPSCVNPDHLEVVAPAENTHRGRSAHFTLYTAVAVRLARATTSLAQVEIADTLGISPQTTSYMLKGKQWRLPGVER